MGGAAFPPCCLTWGQTMVEVMKIMETSLKRSLCALLHSVPQPCSRPPLTHASVVDSWTFTSKSRSVSCWLINKRLLLSMSSERSIVSCYSPVLSRWQWWLVFSKSIIRGNLESLSVFLFLCIGRVNGDLCRMEFSISALQCISPRWNLAP